MQTMDDVEDPSKCVKFLHLFWKFCTCIFSHVTLVSLVVAYCIMGAFVFVHLEANNEQQVKHSIQGVRNEVTEKIWRLTLDAEVLWSKNWTENVTEYLLEFETILLKKMKAEGWNGSEEDNQNQWTLLGALFYSIIVITTIGYGHIAPKTQAGKVVTIFYAILGIPLMLLCLSNIGDIMATSFRFLYWKVCCYVCTKPPRRRRHRSVRSNTVRHSGRYSNRTASFRRSIRTSQRSADSALGLSDGMTRSSYSDTECRYNLEGMEFSSDFTTGRPSTMTRYSDIPVSSPRVKGNRLTTGTASLDRRAMVNPTEASRIPILFNKYALNPEDESPINEPSIVGAKRTVHPTEAEMIAPSSRIRGTGSLPRHHHLNMEIPSMRRQMSQPAPEIREPRSSVYVDLEPGKRSTRMRRAQSYYGRSQQREAPSPRIMSPMGFAVHRQVYTDDFEVDYDYYPGDYVTQKIKPVPIWLCVFLVVSYILGGAALFSSWEQWSFLNSAYFCFITLTTIGFGDFVPSRKLNDDKSIAFCSLYLLFGISLLAMSFNLVQEEVITNVKSVAKSLGIIKDHEEDDEDED